MSEQQRHPQTGRFVPRPAEVGRAAESPANTGEQRGTAWPGFPMPDDRVAQIGLPYAPPVVAAVVLPGDLQAVHGEASHGYARPSGPVSVDRLGAVEQPGIPELFPRSLPMVQPMVHTAPINKGTGR